jgi:iron(III) transport system substrate-binding protein
MTSRRHFLLGSAALGAGLAAPAVVRAQAAAINLYSARHYDTDEALYRDFTAQTGIRINRIDADADALIQRMRAEGANSPADVLITVDAGRLERAKAEGLLQPIQSATLTDKVPANVRSPDGHWFGFSMRARVIMYDRTKVNPEQIANYEDLADPRWRGQILVRAANHVYNQSLVGSLIAALGPERTEAWCRGVAANLARPARGGDRDQIRGVAAGEGSLAISNTYYLGNIVRANAAQDAGVLDKVRIVFPNQGNRGTHVNISGGGVAAGARNKEGAVRFLEYLVSPQAQRYFAEGNDEYPVVAGVPAPASIARFGTFKPDQLNAAVYAGNAAEAVRIMDRAGWR